MSSSRSEDFCKRPGCLHYRKCFLCFSPVTENQEHIPTEAASFPSLSLAQFFAVAKASRWHNVRALIVWAPLETVVWSVLPGGQGEVFCMAFGTEFLLCWSAESRGWHSVRWAWVMSGGLRARNTDWTLMEGLMQVCERSAVNFGFESPSTGSSLSFLEWIINMLLSFDRVK